MSVQWVQVYTTNILQPRQLTSTMYYRVAAMFPGD